MAHTRIALSAFVVLSALGTACPAMAQMENNAMKPIAEPTSQNNAPRRQPQGLPGAQSQQANAATPLMNAVPLDMPPTQALFDAINRGDISTARDALSRGADINAHNVLGMTPLDSSIDLGRNDISFLLLSMRGAGPSGPPQQTAQGPAKPVRPTRVAREQERRGAAQPRVTASATIAASRNPRLFAGDGGTPAPQVGFLGFDSGRSR